MLLTYSLKNDKANGKTFPIISIIKHLAEGATAYQTYRNAEEIAQCNGETSHPDKNYKALLGLLIASRATVIGTAYKGYEKTKLVAQALNPSWCAYELYLSSLNNKELPEETIGEIIPDVVVAPEVEPPTETEVVILEVVSPEIEPATETEEIVTEVVEPEVEPVVETEEVILEVVAPEVEPDAEIEEIVTEVVAPEVEPDAEIEEIITEVVEPEVEPSAETEELILDIVEPLQ